MLIGANIALTNHARRKGGGGLLAETKAYFAAGVADGGTAAPDEYKAIVDTLVAGLKDAGVWSVMDFVHLLRGHDSKVSLVNLANPATNKASPVNSPTFTAYVGYLGDGASAHLITGFNPVTTAQKFERNSAHLGAWGVVDLAANGSPLIGSPTTENALFPRNVNGAMTGRISTVTLSTPNTTIADSRGHSLVTRTNATTQTLYKSGLQVAVDTASASLAVSDAVTFYLRAASSYAARRIAIGHGGAGLTAQQVSDLNTLFAAYITATDALAA